VKKVVVVKGYPKSIFTSRQDLTKSQKAPAPISTPGVK
jgi:hypothetical protein